MKTQTPRPRTRGTDRQAYILQNVPRDLIRAAIDKCKAQDPPVSLRWQLERLLKEWVGEIPEAGEPL